MARYETGKGAQAVLVTAASTLVTGTESSRLHIYLYNPSTAEVWLSLGTTALAKKGIWLKKEVGAVHLEDWTGEIKAITTTGEGEITFVSY